VKAKDGRVESLDGAVEWKDERAGRQDDDPEAQDHPSATQIVYSGRLERRRVTFNGRRAGKNGGREEKKGAGESFRRPRGSLKIEVRQGNGIGDRSPGVVVSLGKAGSAIQSLYIPRNFSAFSPAATIQAVKLASRLICVAVRSVSRVL
jgi:hypothetical protein